VPCLRFGQFERSGVDGGVVDEDVDRFGDLFGLLDGLLHDVGPSLELAKKHVKFNNADYSIVVRLDYTQPPQFECCLRPSRNSP
jgi:hypothetical protein